MRPVQRKLSLRSQSRTMFPIQYWMHWFRPGRLNQGGFDNCGFYFRGLSYLEDQGWRSSQTARLPLMQPGLESGIRRRKWVDIVVGFSCLLQGLRALRFSSLHKNLNSNLIWKHWTESHSLWDVPLEIPFYLYYLRYFPLDTAWCWTAGRRGRMNDQRLNNWL